MRRISLAIIGFLLAGCTAPLSQRDYDTKIYVALEGEGSIAVIDPLSREVIDTIDLSLTEGSNKHIFNPHNVQVAPDGKTVWVTANHGHSDAEEDEHGEHGFLAIPKVYACETIGSGASVTQGEDGIEPCDEEDVPDAIIIIDPLTDEITERIPLEHDAHLAHVAVSKDGSRAYATAQEKGRIYVLNAQTYEIIREIAAPEGSQPHGLRVSPDGKSVYIALLGGKALGILDAETLTLQTRALGGAAVQAGITPDGKTAFASLFDTKQLALLDTSTAQISHVDLPESAKGPLQMYPTPDSQFVYMADQGFYFNQPVGNSVFRVDLTQKRVIKEILVGEGPHGIVISSDGKEVYVTNIVSGDMSVINTTTDAEVSRIHVGEQPNGISIWSSTQGGTP